LTTYRGGDGPWRAGDGNPFSPTLGGGADYLWGSSVEGENSYEDGGPCRSSWQGIDVAASEMKLEFRGLEIVEFHG
jgi:hypothetical protein